MLRVFHQWLDLETFQRREVLNILFFNRVLNLLVSHHARGKTPKHPCPVFIVPREGHDVIPPMAPGLMSSKKGAQQTNVKAPPQKMIQFIVIN